MKNVDFVDMIEYYASPTPMSASTSPHAYYGHYLDSIYTKDESKVSVENFKISSFVFSAMPVTHNVMYESMNSVHDKYPDCYSQQLYGDLIRIKPDLDLIDEYLSGKYIELCKRTPLAAITANISSITEELTQDILDTVVGNEFKKFNNANGNVADAVLTKLFYQNNLHDSTIDDSTLYHSITGINEGIEKIIKYMTPDEEKVMSDLGFITNNMDYSFLNPDKTAILIGNSVVIKDGSFLYGFEDSNITTVVSKVINKLTGFKSVNYVGIDSYISNLIKLQDNSANS